MKGQAFIGLPNEQSAEKALRETNGFVLHDKPLVVVSFYSPQPPPPHPKQDETRTRVLLKGTELQALCFS